MTNRAARFQFSLLSLFAAVTFAAVMFWLARLGTLWCILAIAIVKHVLVAWLCCWYMQTKRARPPLAAPSASAVLDSAPPNS